MQYAPWGQHFTEAEGFYTSIDCNFYSLVTNIFWKINNSIFEII